MRRPKRAVRIGRRQPLQVRRRRDGRRGCRRRTRRRRRSAACSSPGGVGRRRPPADDPPTTSSSAAPTAGSTCRRPRPSRRSTRILAPTPLHHLHLRFPQHHRADARPEVRPEEQGSALRAAVLGQPVRPGQPTIDFKVKLTNLGLALRPDLFDAHTLHWHGFRNVIPFFDGEPTGSVAVPTGREFTYVYRPRDPGTYMYHCHVEDVEHVHMGMNGLVFVRPLQNGNTGSIRAASTCTTTA